MLVRGIQFWNAEGLSLKQNKLKYGAFFFSLSFRRAKLNHSNSIAAKGFQCDLKIRNSGNRAVKSVVIWVVDLVKELCCETT